MKIPCSHGPNAERCKICAAENEKWKNLPPEDKFAKENEANEANKLLLEVKKLVAQGKLKARVLDGAAYLPELAGTVTIAPKGK